MRNFRYLIGLVLLLVASITYADSSSFNFTNSLLCNPSDPHSGYCDLSLQVLSTVFGRVGTGTDPSSLPNATIIAMGYMFRIFNQGVCAIIGLVTCYGVYTFAMKSTATSMQQESSKSIFALLRITIGIALILPQATGYSLMQQLVMKTVVYGSGFADKIYSTVLTGLGEGTMVIFDKKLGGGLQEMSGQSEKELEHYKKNEIKRIKEHQGQTSFAGLNTAIGEIAAASANNGLSAAYNKKVADKVAEYKANFKNKKSTIDLSSDANIEKVFNPEMKKFLVTTYDYQLCNSLSNIYTSRLHKLKDYGLTKVAYLPQAYNNCKINLANESQTDNPQKLSEMNASMKSCMEKNNSVYAHVCADDKNKEKYCIVPNTTAEALTLSKDLRKWFLTNYLPGLGFPSSTEKDKHTEPSLPDSYTVTNNISVKKEETGSNQYAKYKAAGAISFGGIKAEDVSKNKKNDNDTCGSISLPPDPSNQVQFMQYPIAQVAQSMKPIVEKYIDTSINKNFDAKDMDNYLKSGENAQIIKQRTDHDTTETPKDIKTAKTTAYNSVIDVGLDYANLSKPMMRALSIQDGSARHKQLRAFVDNAKKVGWVSAGRYYYDLIKLNNYVQNFTDKAEDKATSLITPKTPALGTTPVNMNKKFDFLKNEKIEDFPTENKNQNDQITQNGQISKQYTEIMAPDIAPTGKTEYEALKLGSGTNLSRKMWNGMALLFTPNAFGLILLLPVINGVAQIASFFDTAGGITDPIVFIHNLGMKIMATSMNALMITSGLIFVTSFAAGFCGGQSPLPGAVNATISFVTGMTKAILVPLIGAGAICAYYIPMYPMIVFTFGVISWLISVVDAMIAMPLVCLGLAHPDGQDFLGKADQATMLLMGVFIRPAVMIFALITAIAVSYVGLRLINIGFVGILLDGIGNAVNTTGATGGLRNDGASVGGVSYLTTMMSLNPTSIDSKIISQAISKAASGFSTSGASGSGSTTAVAGAGPLIWVVAIPCMLIVYTMMVYSIVTQCFGMMSEIVQGVLKWVGGPQITDSSSQATQQIQSGVASGASTVAGVAGGSTEAASSGGEVSGKALKETKTKKG